MRSSGFVLQCLAKHVFSLLELLMRGKMQEGDWIRGSGQPDLPDVVQEDDGCVQVTTANRRLTVLMMYQALNRDRAIEVTRHIES